MLSRLTKAWRFRSAGILAVLYLLCVLAPSAAFAFGDGSRAAHCLTESSAHVHHKSTGAADHDHDHDHGDGSGSEHSQGDQGTADAQCCGLFCLSVLPASLTDVAAPALPSSVDDAIAPRGVTGSVPDSLYRPPIAALSI